MFLQCFFKSTLKVNVGSLLTNKSQNTKQWIILNFRRPEEKLEEKYFLSDYVSLPKSRDWKTEGNGNENKCATKTQTSHKLI